MEQAISRLGLTATKQYVDAICNRAFYAVSNKKYADLFETLWEHSLCCAIGSQAVCEILKLKFQIDIFTAVECSLISFLCIYFNALVYVLTLNMT